MKNPCKLCLVRPACTEDCNDYKKFIDYATHRSAVLTMFLSCILFAAILIYFGDIFSNKPDKEFLQILWIGTVIPNCIYNFKTKGHFSYVAIVAFSPFMSLLILFINLFCMYDKRCLRKRV